MKRLYVAYGSNLNLEHMRFRCPTAKVVGKGILNNYRLLFKGIPYNAFATIEPYKNKKVPVVVWELKSEDEKSLDRYEGYPDLYYKEDIKVEMENKETVKTMAYIMAD